jgi:hypothetical protein
MTEETPTQAIVAAARPVDVTLDPDGRKIVVRKMTPVEQFRFKKVIGRYMDNAGYLMDAMMAASVRSVDGNPMPFPQSEADVEFILVRLGDDGWAAVQEHFFSLAADPAEDKDAAKN